MLELEASDVIHSWWIPKFGAKADAVPGYVNETWFKVPNEGTYRGQCAELCGSGHADMRAKVVAVSPDEFKAVGPATSVTRSRRPARSWPRSASRGERTQGTSGSRHRNR